jgi:hypothetical protein
MFLGQAPMQMERALLVQVYHSNDQAYLWPSFNSPEHGKGVVGRMKNKVLDLNQKAASKECEMTDELLNLSLISDLNQRKKSSQSLKSVDLGYCKARSKGEFSQTKLKGGFISAIKSSKKKIENIKERISKKATKDAVCTVRTGEELRLHYFLDTSSGMVTVYEEKRDRGHRKTEK